MCCFSRPVRLVCATKIFARGLADGRQMLAYAMSVELDEELAMVLPLPVPPSPGDDAVEFINLEGYDALFDDLNKAFPVMLAASAPQARGYGPPVQSALVVHDVGDYEASFVPTMKDFARLDERFRMPAGVWEHLPTYAEYGFAVFKLKPGKNRQKVHPMAFTFPRREPSALFLPTVHVHDGTVPETARFDHALYCQPSPLLEAVLPWDVSTGPLGDFVDTSRTHGLVDGARSGNKTVLMGDLPNEDTWLREPAGVTAEDLAPRGDCFSARVKAITAYMTFSPQMHDYDRRLRWKATATDELPRLAAGMREGLTTLTDAQREAWKLAPLSDALPPYWLNGRMLFTGEPFGGQRSSGGGPGRVLFRPFTDHVEVQEVTLGFSQVPDEAACKQIEAALQAVLDRAVGAA